ncbi:MAG: RNA 3'-terminal-phosphate cyclase [Euryarchaeota archaeon RBG_16_68_12]|nr:MAG: RNA 3'-terminal-phosphate cyclase [Euryarchaeota archaeon RBG_16_68_12]
MITVDGSHGEGGGQIVRMAVALSALTTTPVRVVNVRAKRKNPGLAAQHSTAIQAVGKVCGARLEGVAVGSTALEFHPGTLRGGSFSFDVGTAGSITLVLQACLPAAFAAGNVEITVRGGTDVPWSPPLDYFGHVFLRLLGKMGGRAKVDVAMRGYYPRGGGLVRVAVEEPPEWRPLRLAPRGDIERIAGRAHISNLPEAVVKRMKSAALQRLSGFSEVRVHDETLGPDRAVGPGGAIVLWADTPETVLGGSALAERGKRAEKVGEEAVVELLKEIEAGATLDVHAADQVLAYVAMAKEDSEFLVREVSEHTRTMMWLLGSFLGTQFEVVQTGGLQRVSVHPGRHREGGA